MAIVAKRVSDEREAEEQTFNWVGTRAVRPDGVDKVTGRAKFGADLHLPNMLVGKMLRSPHAHARILSIDISSAEKLPGVKAIVTREDFSDLASEFVPAGEMMVNYRDITRNVMAREKVLYEGHALAAVAAVNAIVAREALALIQVDYEVLPHVLDVVEAMKPEAVLIQEDLLTDGADPPADRYPAGTGRTGCPEGTLKRRSEARRAGPNAPCPAV